MSTNKLDSVFSLQNEVNAVFVTNDNQHQQKGHEFVRNPAERARLEKELEERRQKIKLRVEQKKKELEELRRLSSSADAALKLNKNTFTKMMKLMWKKMKSIEQQGRSFQHGDQTGLQVHLDLISQDTEDLKEQISLRVIALKTEDAYKFLLKNNALLELSERPKNRLTFRHWLPFRKFALDKTPIPMSVTDLSAFYEEGPDSHFWNIDYFGWEAVFRSITWDPNTAHRNVELLSKGGQWAIFKAQPRDYPDHPDRFTDSVQVLSKEPLRGPCYFEVYPRGDCYIGVTYKSIARKSKGKQSIIGLNDKSWACFGGGFVPQNTENGTWLLVMNMKRPYKVAVVLDQRQGILRFYSGTMGTPGLSIMCEVERKFTKPLYFGAVFVTPGDNVVIPKMEAGRDIVFIPTGSYIHA